MQIYVKINPAMESLMSRLGGDLHGGLRSGMINLVEEVEARAVKEAPVKTSNLVDSITSYASDDGTFGVVKVRAFNERGVEYGKFVHQGTGIYGPHKKPIKPVTKKALFWRGAAHPVKSIKGMKPRPFLTDAGDDTDVQKSYETGLRNYLKRKGW